MRIAGVTVGKVVSTQLDPKGNRTMATIQLQSTVRADPPGHARDPAHQDDPRRDLRPADPGSAERAADRRRRHAAARPGAARRSSSTDIFNTFDPTTRHAFQVWQQELAKAVSGNDQNLNDVLGNLPTFAADATDILQVLDVQHLAVVSLVQNGGTVFGALGAEPDRAAQPDHERRDDVRHDRRQQQRARADLPGVPDVPERDQGDDGQAADVLDQHRPADQGARSRSPSSSGRRCTRSSSSRRPCATCSRTSGR